MTFSALSYEDLLTACEALTGVSKNLSDMLADFKQYLGEQGLSSSWEKILDVVNCAGFPQEVVEGNVYFCPTVGGAYSHMRSKYFGMYRSRKVEKVAIIEAVVDLDSFRDGTVKWKNVKVDEDYLKIAREKHRKWRNGEFPKRVFLLGKLEDTAFYKNTKGGMFGSKRYFDVGQMSPKNVQDLANKLRGKSWPEKSWTVEP